MTAILLALILTSLSFVCGWTKGHDDGFREANALQMLRGAFVERPMRRRLP